MTEQGKPYYSNHEEKLEKSPTEEKVAKFFHEKHEAMKKELEALGLEVVSMGGSASKGFTDKEGKTAVLVFTIGVVDPAAEGQHKYACSVQAEAQQEAAQRFNPAEILKVSLRDAARHQAMKKQS